MPYKDKDTVKIRWSIGEVARLARIEPHTIRFYEKEFGWLKPLYKNSSTGSRRAYTKDGVNNVLEVIHLLKFGLSIRGIHKAYEDNYYNDVLEFFGYKRYDTNRKN